MLQGNVGEFSSAVLQLKGQGIALLDISCQLTTGQILLRPGKALQDSPEVAIHIRGVRTKPLTYSLDRQWLDASQNQNSSRHSQ